MVLQYIQNAGSDGAKRSDILEYLQDTLPIRNTKEQNLRMLGNILSGMSKKYFKNVIILKASL